MYFIGCNWTLEFNVVHQNREMLMIIFITTKRETLNKTQKNIFLDVCQPVHVPQLICQHVHPPRGRCSRERRGHLRQRTPCSAIHPHLQQESQENKGTWNHEDHRIHHHITRCGTGGAIQVISQGCKIHIWKARRKRQWGLKINGVLTKWGHTIQDIIFK